MWAFFVELPITNEVFLLIVMCLSTFHYEPFQTAPASGLTAIPASEIGLLYCT